MENHDFAVDRKTQNPQCAIDHPNRQSAIPIDNRQSQSAIGNLKIDNRQSEIRNRRVSQTPSPERCIRVSASGLVATYPSTHAVKEAASETEVPTVSSLFELHANGVYRLALAM